MEPTNNGWRDRVRAFLAGDYPGAPVDYAMAIAIVFGMMAVILLSLVRETLPAAGETLLTILRVLLTGTP